MSKRVLPGFGLSLGFTLLYTSLFVLLPLGALVLFSTRMSWDEFLDKAIRDPRVFASYKLALRTSFLAATLNGVFGFITAWVLVRYRFPCKRLVDALVDLPFALPTAVSGIALTTLYAHTGWMGSLFAPHGIQIAFAPAGITIALTMIGLPFVVRTVQPALEDLEVELEEAASSLGASRFQTFRKVIFPAIFPAVLTGFTLSFARAVGEFGSVIFISGNMPFRTEIPPFMILIKLEQFDYLGAAAIGVVMLFVSFVCLFIINLLQAWARRNHA